MGLMEGAIWCKPGSLYRRIQSMNKKTSDSVRSKLREKDLELLNLSWPLEKMEKYYLNDLESLVNGDKIKNKDMQRYFFDYVSLRNVLANENGAYVAIPTNDFKEPHPKLHYEKTDKIFKKLLELALGKGYDIKIHSYDFQ